MPRSHHNEKQTSRFITRGWLLTSAAAAEQFRFTNGERRKEAQQLENDADVVHDANKEDDLAILFSRLPFPFPLNEK